MGRVRSSGKVGEALFDLYLGEQPVSGKAKVGGIEGGVGKMGR